MAFDGKPSISMPQPAKQIWPLGTLDFEVKRSKVKTTVRPIHFSSKHTDHQFAVEEHQASFLSVYFVCVLFLLENVQQFTHNTWRDTY